MRPLVLLLLACLAFGAAPLRAASNPDPGDLFVNAYMAVQQGEKAEESGNFKGALTKFRYAATVLDQIASSAPSWQPQIVSYRKSRTAEAVVRVQEKIARFGAGKADPGEGALGLPSTPLPRGDSEKPLIFEPEPVLSPSTGSPAPAAGSSKSSPRKTQPERSAESDPLEEAQRRMQKLQADLKKAKDEAEHLEKEKADLAQKLEEAVKSRADSDKKQQLLQKRADNAEQALMKAVGEGKADTDRVKALQADVATAKRDVRTFKIEAEADAEYRQQLDDRYSKALGKIAKLTQERDSATQTSVDVPGRIAKIQQDLDRTTKERDALADKLQKTEGQLVVVQQQRDDALTQVAKLKDAQKQVDKLVADNTTLMAKLADAEKSINQFKTEGAQKDQQIAALKKDVVDVKEQLVIARKESADYQRQMADMQVKLEESGKQLAQAKAENAASAAEKKKMQDENMILRGIVLREQKEEAVRAKTRKVLLAEMADLEINSKTLLKQIDLISQPVVKLTDKERALFRNPELQVSDTEISLAVPKEEESVPSRAVEPVVPAAPVNIAETSRPSVSTPKATPLPVNNSVPPAPAPVPNVIVVPPPAATPAQSPKVAVASTPPAKPAATPQKTAPAKVAEAAKPPEKSRTPEPALPLPEPKPAFTLETPPKEAGIGPLASSKPPSTLPPEPPKSTSPAEKLPTLEELPNLTNQKPATGLTETVPSTTMEPSGPGSGASSGAPNVPAELLPLAREGKDQFERGNYAEAEKTYRKILARAPNNLYTLSNLGVVLFRAGKFKPAEDSFKKAIAIAPEDGFSHCTLGIVFYSEQKYDEAVNELTKALALNPKNATAHNYLGITASQKGWQEAAQKELETAVTLDPTYADAHFNLAVVYAMQTPPNKEKAREHYKLATQYGAEPDSALEQLIKAP